VAAGELASGPAAARLAVLFGAPFDVEKARRTAARLYGILEVHLAGRRFLIGSEPTIADLALYAYTARASEGGVSLDGYQHLRAWIARVEELQGFVPMMKASG
jgi:glutathione S-transferase